MVRRRTAEATEAPFSQDEATHGAMFPRFAIAAGEGADVLVEQCAEGAQGSTQSTHSAGAPVEQVAIIHE